MGTLMPENSSLTKYLPENYTPKPKSAKSSLPEDADTSVLKAGKLSKYLPANIENFGPYDTFLNAEEEKEYQQWKQVNAPDDSGVDYDYRGAFKEGAYADESKHWPDTFKKPSHPTFSTESIYASKAPDLAGKWEGEEYIPTPKKLEQREQAFIRSDPMARYAQKTLLGRMGLKSRVLLDAAKDVPRATKQQIKDSAPIGAMKVLATALTQVDEQVAAKFIQMSKGIDGASAISKENEKIKEANIESAAFNKRTKQKYGDKYIAPFIPIKVTDVAQLPENLAYSIASMGVGLAVGSPIALIPAPGARGVAFLSGSAASGKAAYEMSAFAVMQSYLETMNDMSVKQRGREITEAEEAKFKSSFKSKAHKYGLWEALPEAASNLGFVSILSAPLTKMVGPGVAKGVLAKMAGIYGEELLTETITQKGQAPIEASVGLREEGNLTWFEALKEVAPQTFLLSTILGGAGNTVVEVKNRLSASLKKEVGADQAESILAMLEEQLDEKKSFSSQLDAQAKQHGQSVEDITVNSMNAAKSMDSTAQQPQVPGIAGALDPMSPQARPQASIPGISSPQQSQAVPGVSQPQAKESKLDKYKPENDNRVPDEIKKIVEDIQNTDLSVKERFEKVKEGVSKVVAMGKMDPDFAKRYVKRMEKVLKIGGKLDEKEKVQTKEKEVGIPGIKEGSSVSVDLGKGKTRKGTVDGIIEVKNGDNKVAVKDSKGKTVWHTEGMITEIPGIKPKLWSDTILEGKKKKPFSAKESIQKERETLQEAHKKAKDRLRKAEIAAKSKRIFGKPKEVDAANKEVQDAAVALKEAEAKLSELLNDTGTQKDKVKKVLSNKNQASIKEVSDETGILEPNVRRILGVGTKEGIFERIEPGIYTLTTNKGTFAYIQVGNALKEIKNLAKKKVKFDMVFLDVPYDTNAIKGGNRNIDYEKIQPAQFDIFLSDLKKTINANTPVFYMFSNAKSGIAQMTKYTKSFNRTGFKPVAKGELVKLDKQGKEQKLYGRTQTPEGIILFTKSGKTDLGDINLQYKLYTPRGKGVRQSTKPETLLRNLIKLGTNEGQLVFDPFAGSGVTLSAAIKEGRSAVGIEKDETALPGIKEKIEDATERFNLGESIKDVGDATTPGGLGMGLGNIGQSKKAKAARQKIFDKHLPAIMLEAKKAGMELKAYLEKFYNFTKEQIEDLLKMSKMVTLDMMPPLDEKPIVYHANPNEKIDGVTPVSPPKKTVEEKIPGVAEQKKKRRKVEVEIKNKFNPEDDTIIKKLGDALKKLKSLRKKQGRMYAAETAERFKKSIKTREKTGGEAGFKKARAMLSGELSKVEFESIREQFTQENIDHLFNLINDSRLISGTEKTTAGNGLLKIFGEKGKGGTLPNNSEIRLLARVFGQTFTKILLDSKNELSKYTRMASEFINVPRAMMASADFSASGRQGYLLSLRNPKLGLKAFLDQFGYFNSQEKFDNFMEWIVAHPYYEMAVRAGLKLTNLGAFQGDREESFRSTLAEKYIPLVQRSERAYVGTLNYLRFMSFVDMMKKEEASHKDGLSDGDKQFLAEQYADLVNTASGRGSLGRLEGVADDLNTLFFSPRLWAGRLKMINPFYHIKNPLFYTELQPSVRKEANKMMLKFMGINGTLLLLGSLLTGDDDGFDILSSDFGKVKIGNTRIDMFAGYQQPARLVAQLLAGKTRSSKTGRTYYLNEGFKPRTRADILLQYVAYKQAPVFSLLTDYLSKQKTGPYRFGRPSKFFDALGDQLNMNIYVPAELSERFSYMFIQDMYDIIEEDPWLAPLGLLGLFGVGVQTY